MTVFIGICGTYLINNILPHIMTNMHFCNKILLYRSYKARIEISLTRKGLIIGLIFYF